MTFLFVVIISVNVAFFSYWSYKMYMEIKFRLVEKWPKVYMILCSCGSRDSFNRIKLEIQIKDENESLKDKFTKSKSSIYQKLINFSSYQGGRSANIGQNSAQ